MKIITKKSVIFTALAVVLLATALVISCNAPLDGNSDKDEPSIPGTGKVRLTINNKNYNRTIQPESLPADIKYILVLEANPNGLGTGIALPAFFAPVTTADTSVGDIPIGTYLSAKVYAYTGTLLTSSTNMTAVNAVAIGEATSTTATININATTPLGLGAFKPVIYKPGTATNPGTGTFAYTIQKNGTRVNTGTFVIKGRSIPDFIAVPSAPFGITFDNNKHVVQADPLVSTSNQIPSGYYNVIFTITDNLNSDTAFFYEILHVYKSMESVYSVTLNDTIFPDLPGNSGTLTLTPSFVPGITVSVELSSSDAAKLRVTNNGQNFVVKILKTATDAELVIKVTAANKETTPVDVTNKIAFSTWNLLTNSGGTISFTPITIVTDNGIVSMTPSTESSPRKAVYTIVFDAQASSLVLNDAPLYYNRTQLELLYDTNEPISLPTIQIQYVSSF